tara:strand:- start:152 stop:655 length:504 start_codon:yes stop_codon:yes gene_type:complete
LADASVTMLSERATVSHLAVVSTSGPLQHQCRPGIRIVIAAAGLLVLAACAATPENSPPAERGTTALSVPERTPAAPPPNDDPARLRGLNASALTALLGDPVRVRRDGTAEIRQYGDVSSCQIDLFLYADGSTATVSHVEIRRGIERLDPAAARSCLRQMLAPRATS